MALFEFHSDWEFQLKIEKFKIFNNPEYINTKDEVENGIFNIEILDEFNSNPDPEEYQINTINYLLDEKHQLNILNNVLEYSKNTIYPHYKTFMRESEYPECYPNLNGLSDLRELYGIDKIIIKRIAHLDFAYYILKCSSCLDHEHGIAITLFNDEVVDHGEDWDDKKVCEHKGIDFDSYHEKLVKDYNHRELVLTKPHPKYGKLKPWQKNQNEFYPFGLFHAGRDKELIQGIEAGLIPKEPIISRILEMSIKNEKADLTQYLIDQNPQFKYSAFREALKKDRYDLTNRMIKQGYDLNEMVAQSSLFYETIGFMEKAISENKDLKTLKVRLRYLLENGLDPYLEDNFRRNSLDRIGRISDKRIKERVENEVMDILKSNSKLINKIKRFFKTR